MKVPVIETQDFTIYLDQDSDHTFIHCDVRVYSGTVKRNLEHALQLLLSIRQTPLLALHDQGDSKHHKFLTLLGFEYLTETQCLDGTERGIYITD